MIKNFLRDETGLELSEYAVAAALIALLYCLASEHRHNKTCAKARETNENQAGVCFMMGWATSFVASG